jgi:hypothetical protein
LDPEAVAEGFTTVRVGALGLAPMPAPFTMVAELSMSVPSAVPARTVTSKTTARLPPAGTARVVRLSWMGVELSMTPGGRGETRFRLPTSGERSSVSDTPVASRPAVSMRVMVYWSTSPGSTSAPLRSTTLLVDVDRSDPTVTIAVLPVE